jgi:hypothetical protein
MLTGVVPHSLSGISASYTKRYMWYTWFNLCMGNYNNNRRVVLINTRGGDARGQLVSTQLVITNSP